MNQTMKPNKFSPLSTLSEQHSFLVCTCSNTYFCPLFFWQYLALSFSSVLKPSLSIQNKQGTLDTVLYANHEKRAVKTYGSQATDHGTSYPTTKSHAKQIFFVTFSFLYLQLKKKKFESSVIQIQFGDSFFLKFLLKFKFPPAMFEPNQSGSRFGFDQIFETRNLSHK